ncbi:MAG TPA: hypothetical protein PLM98_16715, partial [Thiolinea sp.]|nr:hypothetical protein [Thiolinea sp.]
MQSLYKIVLIVLLILLSYPLNAADKIDPPFLFIGQERLFGKQIWQTDNTESGTHIYAYAQQQPNADANPYPMGILENIVIFSAFSGTGTHLWRTDGTPEGTFSLKDMLIGHNKDFSVDERDFQQITAKLGSKLFFWSIGAHSIDLSVTDGSQSGTQVLKSFPLKTSLNIFSRFYSLPTQVHFAVENGAQGVEWWRSDGSVAGTQRVMDAQQLQGAGSHDFDNHNNEAEVLVGEQAIYFRRHKQRKAKSFEEDAGVLWKVTEQGAEKLHEFSPEEWPYRLLGVYDDQLFWQFQYNKNYGMNSELWRIKLSTQQTEKLHEFNDKAEALDEIGALHVFNNHLYLSLYTAGENQLWASDLATKDTQLLTTLSDSRDYSYGSPVWFEFAG